MRFYLIDRITKMDIGKSIEGIKCWTLSDEIFNEHFPGFPVVPGVLITESMSQLLGILIEESHKEIFNNKQDVYALLSIIHNAKFRDIVIPGDKCEIRGKLKSIDLNRGSGFVEVFVDGKLMAEAALSFLIYSKDVLPVNDFIHKRKEYFQVITKKQPKR